MTCVCVFFFFLLKVPGTLSWVLSGYPTTRNCGLVMFLRLLFPQCSASQSSGTHSCLQPTDWSKVIGCQVTRTPVTEVVKLFNTKIFLKMHAKPQTVTRTHLYARHSKMHHRTHRWISKKKKKNKHSNCERVHKHAYSTHLNAHWNYTLNWVLWMNYWMNRKTKTKKNISVLS